MLILRLLGTSIVFFILWAYWFGDFLTTWGGQAITQHGLTGVEALIMGNLNLLLFLAYCVYMLVAVYLGGSNE